MDTLITFQKKIAYQFKQPQILSEALTHKSYAHESLPAKMTFSHNERLEFLGDAVLDLGVSTLLMHYDFAATEGELSKRRASLVNEKTLAEVAREMNLSAVVLLGRGEQQSGGFEKDSILSSTLEAIVGAIYLDGGFEAAYQFVKRLFDSRVDELSSSTLSFARDYKSRLQEHVQSDKKVTPKYQIEETIGPEHDKVFHVSVTVGDEKLGRGAGKSRKDAEQDAARIVLESLNL